MPVIEMNGTGSTLVALVSAALFFRIVAGPEGVSEVGLTERAGGHDAEVGAASIGTHIQLSRSRVSQIFKVGCAIGGAGVLVFEVGDLAEFNACEISTGGGVKDVCKIVTEVGNCVSALCNGACLLASMCSVTDNPIFGHAVRATLRSVTVEV